LPRFREKIKTGRLLAGLFYFSRRVGFVNRDIYNRKHNAAAHKG